MASILRMDDDVRTVMAEILRQAGHRVDTTPNGKAGLASTMPSGTT
jgi:CheY-like chemotaxis protein